MPPPSPPPIAAAFELLSCVGGEAVTESVAIGVGVLVAAVDTVAADEVTELKELVLRVGVLVDVTILLVAVSLTVLKTLADPTAEKTNPLSCLAVSAAGLSHRRIV